MINRPGVEQEMLNNGFHQFLSSVGFLTMSPWQWLLEVDAVVKQECWTCVGLGCGVVPPTSSPSKVLSLQFQVPSLLRLQALSHSHRHGLFNIDIVNNLVVCIEQKVRVFDLIILVNMKAKELVSFVHRVKKESLKTNIFVNDMERQKKTHQYQT